MQHSTCRTCAQSMPAYDVAAGALKCSRCKWAERKRVPCTVCGGPTGWPISSAARAAAEPKCHECRRNRPGYRIKQMAASGILERWNCAGCGIGCERPATKGQRPKWCGLCRQRGRDWIPKDVRRSVYELDEWHCKICTELVDHNLIGTASPWRPSLDHIKPRSQGGSDDPSNLRLAHFWCNSALNDGRSYTDADFRASA